MPARYAGQRRRVRQDKTDNKKKTNRDAPRGGTKNSYAGERCRPASQSNKTSRKGFEIIYIFLSRTDQPLPQSQANKNLKKREKNRNATTSNNSNNNPICHRQHPPPSKTTTATTPLPPTTPTTPPLSTFVTRAGRPHETTSSVGSPPQRRPQNIALFLTTRQTACTLERLTLGFSRPLDPTGSEVPFVDGITTRPISTTLR